MKNLLLAAMLFCTNIAIAQGTIEDYRRAYSAGEKFSANKVSYSNVNPEWIGQTHYFWYVRNTPDGRIYVLVDADTQNRKDLFDHKLVAAALSEASGRKIEATSLIWIVCLSTTDWIRYISFSTIIAGCMSSTKIS